VVCEWQNGRLEIRYRGQKMAWEELPGKPQRAAMEKQTKKAKPYGGTPPTASHPWKQGYQGMTVWRPPEVEGAQPGPAVASASP